MTYFGIAESNLACIGKIGFPISSKNKVASWQLQIYDSISLASVKALR